MAPSRTTRTRVAAAGAAALVALAYLASLPTEAGTAPAAAATVADTGTAGAAGIGDPYFPFDGNGGYDARHYNIAVDYAPSTGALAGTTTVQAVARQALDRFNLDLVLAPTAVRVVVNGLPETLARGTGPGTFHRSNTHELVVDPTAVVTRGSRFSVTVTYRGTPKAISWKGESPWLSNRSETMATNEPHIAPWWFPVNDHPRDRATFSVALTVPSGKEAISNGAYLGQTTQGTKTTWKWRMSQPIAPYLAFFAAGDFTWKQGTAQGLRYFNAVSNQLSPDQRSKAMRLMERTPGIVRWLESQFGRYPYGWTGGVTTALPSGFALENASRPTYPYLGNGGYARTTVVHELAHQWFGDEVSVNRWRDIWLNEGFATWVEWRYVEAHGGWNAQRTLRSHYSSYLPSDPFWKLTIGDPGPRKLFNYPVYERGAMALQALRHRIGNRDFQKVMRLWVKRHADGTGRVGQFRRLAQEVSGQNLKRFFTVWLFTPERPARTKANGLR